MRQYISVVDSNNEPLMPTSPGHARQLLKSGRAIKRWYKGVFGIKLLDRKAKYSEYQEVVIGVDPGSKR